MQAAENDSTKTTKKKSFGERLLQPIKWIGKNWSAYDKNYSVPSFYNWAFQLQNTTSYEWLRMESPEGMDINMRAKVSHRLGPYLGYQFMFYGYTVDINSLGSSSKRKNEFTLSINSNLVNADIIRRRTGGDFIITKLNFHDDVRGTIDLTDVADTYELGDYIKNSLTGVNLNVFLNHKKYSNPAAFSTVPSSCARWARPSWDWAIPTRRWKATCRTSSTPTEPN
jgi:hypothetical protein